MDTGFHIMLEDAVDHFMIEMAKENDPKLQAIEDGIITIDDMRYFGAFITLIGSYMDADARANGCSVMELDYASIQERALDDFCDIYRQEEDSVRQNIERIRVVLLRYDPIIEQSIN